MRRCKICKSTNDVRGDGICMGCYDARMATAVGMSYGKYVSMYGHNYMRRIREKKPLRLCPVCGMVIPTGRRERKYCSDRCRRRARYFRRHPDPPSKNRRSCRGCRWYVPGSCRCVNQDSQMFGTSINKGCTLYDRLAVDDG
ncbi:MAG: hypothetical protein ACI4PO_08045 [Faecousia sp.]